jgi:hypothetical protein
LTHGRFILARALHRHSTISEYLMQRFEDAAERYSATSMKDNMVREIVEDVVHGRAFDNYEGPTPESETGFFTS